MIVILHKLRSHVCNRWIINAFCDIIKSISFYMIQEEKYLKKDMISYYMFISDKCITILTELLLMTAKSR